jgi:hypothetical protein
MRRALTVLGIVLGAGVVIYLLLGSLEDSGAQAGRSTVHERRDAGNAPRLETDAREGESAPPEEPVARDTPRATPDGQDLVRDASTAAAAPGAAKKTGGAIGRLNNLSMSDLFFRAQIGKLDADTLIGNTHLNPNRTPVTSADKELLWALLAELTHRIRGSFVQGSAGRMERGLALIRSGKLEGIPLLERTPANIEATLKKAIDDLAELEKEGQGRRDYSRRKRILQSTIKNPRLWVGGPRPEPRPGCIEIVSNGVAYRDIPIKDLDSGALTQQVHEFLFKQFKELTTGWFYQQGLLSTREVEGLLKQELKEK